MSEAIELATAYVHVIPSFKGSERVVASEFGEPMAAEAEKAGSKAGKRFSTGWSAAAVGAGMLAVAGVALKGLYDIGSQYDDLSDTIRVGTGATGEALTGLVDVARDIATEIPADLATIGPVVSDLSTRLGLTGDDLQTVAKQVLEAGRIMGEPIDVASATAAFSQYGLGPEQISEGMDHLFRVSQATGVGINELTSLVATAGPALQSLGFSFEESAAMIGLFDKAGLDAAGITKSMGKAMLNLAKDGEEPKEAFARVTGELQELVDSGDKVGALNLASELFGTKGAPQFLSMLESGQINMEDLAGAAGLTGDTILGVAEETMDFPEKFQVLMSKLMEAIEPLATKVFGALGDALDDVSPHLEGFATWLSENPGALKGIATLIGGVVVVALGLMTAAMIANNIAMLTSPITWWIVGIAALIAGIVALALNWDVVTAWLTTVWAGFMSWITEVLNGFVGWWNGLWAGVGAAISNVWNSIVLALQGFWNMVTAIFLNTTVVGLIIQHWGTISAFTQSVWNAIVGFITSAVGWIGTSVSTGFQNIWNFFVTFGANVRSFFGGIVDSAVTFGADIISGLLRGLRSMSGKIASFFGDLLPSWVTGPFAEALGIHSPSRVFMELGGHTADGFMIGAEQKQDAIAKTMSTMVTVPDVPASSVSPANATTEQPGQSGPAVVVHNYNPVAAPESETVRAASGMVAAALKL